VALARLRSEAGGARRLAHGFEVIIWDATVIPRFAFQPVALLSIYRARGWGRDEHRSTR
jgi:hypothetical protein